MNTSPSLRFGSLSGFVHTAAAQGLIVSGILHLASDQALALGPNDLDGRLGFRLIGPFNPEAAGGAFEPSGVGTSVAAGDFNGDGLDDIVAGNPARNEIYIVFSQTNSLRAEQSLADLDGTNGVRIVPGNPLLVGFLGYSVAALGDVNGDGIEDIGLGAPTALSGQGLAAVIFGRPDFPAQMTVADLDGTDGFRIISSSLASFPEFGRSITSPGDFNADGLADIAIGASQVLDTNNNGLAFLVFGSSNVLGDELDVASLGGTNGMVFGYDTLGFYESRNKIVDGPGDVNGDGIDDLAIGSHARGALLIPLPMGGPIDSCWIVYGSGGPKPAYVDLATIQGGTNGLHFIRPAVGDVQLGQVMRKGNFDGGTNTQLLITVTTGANFGESQLIVLRNTADLTNFPIDLGDSMNKRLTLTSPLSPIGAATRFGRDTVFADLNGDGLDEIIGGDGARVSVLFGTSGYQPDQVFGPFPAPVGLSIAAQQSLFGLNNRGIGLGDFNGDGTNDIAVGEPLFQSVAFEGAVSVYFGQSFRGAITAISPSNGSVGVDPLVLLAVTGSTRLSGGSLQLFRLSDGSPLDTASLALASTDGRSLFFRPTRPLPRGIAIGVTYQSFTDLYGNVLPGQTNLTDWTFTTLTSSILTLGANPNPAEEGDPVTLLASARNAAAEPVEGAIQFLDGTNLLGTSGLDAAGFAQLTVTNLAVGLRAIHARFPGNAATEAGAVILQPPLEIQAAPSAGTTGAGGTGAGTGSTGTTGSGGLAGLPWTVEVKRPKANAQVKIRSGKGLGSVRGAVSDTDLPAKSRSVEVEIALITEPTNASAVAWSSAKVGKVNKKGRAKFSASKVGADSEIASGTSFQIWVRASSNFAVASSDTNRVDLEAK